MTVFVCALICLTLVFTAILFGIFKLFGFLLASLSSSPELIVLPKSQVPEGQADPWEAITPEKRYELYTQNEERIQEFAQKNSESFEKAMLFLSTGGLTLSVTLLGLIKDRKLEYPFLMPLSWVFFAGAIGFMIWSYQVTRDSYDRQLTVLDRRYFEYSDETNELMTEPSKITNIAVWLFHTGIVCLCAFGLINGGNIMGLDKTGKINEDNPPRVSTALGKPPARPKGTETVKVDQKKTEKTK